MKTMPPCKVDGVECGKRYIGCRAECEVYHQWLAVHNEEVEAERAAKAREMDIADFEGKRYLRKKLDTQRKLDTKRRRGLHG